MKKNSFQNFKREKLNTPIISIHMFFVWVGTGSTNQSFWKAGEVGIEHASLLDGAKLLLPRVSRKLLEKEEGR